MGVGGVLAAVFVAGCGSNSSVGAYIPNPTATSAAAIRAAATALPTATAMPSEGE